jgi:hypothetical protein
MSPSGDASILSVKPVPGPLVLVRTRLAPTSNSLETFVVTEGVAEVELLPVAAAIASRGDV